MSSFGSDFNYSPTDLYSRSPYRASIAINQRSPSAELDRQDRLYNLILAGDVNSIINQVESRETLIEDLLSLSQDGRAIRRIFLQPNIFSLISPYQRVRVISEVGTNNEDSFEDWLQLFHLLETTYGSFDLLELEDILLGIFGDRNFNAVLWLDDKRRNILRFFTEYSPTVEEW